MDLQFYTVLICFVLKALEASEDDNKVHIEFLKFMSKYKKTYLPGSTEFETRFEYFKVCTFHVRLLFLNCCFKFQHNLYWSKKLNGEPTTESQIAFGINKFSDLSGAEFAGNFE